MKKFTQRLTVIAFGIGLTSAAVIYFTSSEPKANAQSQGDKRDVPHMDGKWIRFSADFAKRQKIEFAAAAEGSLKPMINVTGTVTFDPDLVAAVGSRIAGRVSRVFKLEGDEVKAGDLLAEIESADLGQAQAAVLAARAHAEAATTNEKREAELAEAKISAHRDAEVAKAQAVSARAELAAAEQRVRALGGTNDGAAGILRLTTPIAGRVVERNVSRGQSVEATLTAFQVADLSRVWVELAVFEGQLRSIHNGDTVDVASSTAGEEPLHGVVAYVGDVIDLATRTAPVRIVVEHPRSRLRPGQSVSATIHTSAPVASAISIPLSAVTSIDGKPTVFIAHDELSVEPRAIVLGAQDGDRVEVTRGVERKDRIAVSGVFALKSEIFR
ncbi:MAG TPA: efflux RND transporter periplasmic adaptor subunit [Polyangiaceae bacterium]|nr:efflux RND transporter periplasmic adaptor subunit [Polyangiaceae bacterium]